MEISKINNQIYLGSIYDALNEKLLRQIGISHIVSIRDNEEEDIPLYKGIHIFRIHCLDSPYANISSCFDKAYVFMDNAITNGGKLFIHCTAGISRSPTVLASYLMRKYKMRAMQALSTIRESRPIIDPNSGFRHQLLRYEKLLFG